MIGLSKPPSALSTRISSWSLYLERASSNSIFFKMSPQSVRQLWPLSAGRAGLDVALLKILQPAGQAKNS